MSSFDIPIYYQRVVSPKGRVSYEPAGAGTMPDLPMGPSLVVVKRNSTSIKCLHTEAEEGRVALLAAASKARDAMLAAMNESARLRPMTSPHSWTATEKRAFEAYRAVFRKAGESEPIGLWASGCIQDAADAGIAALVEAAEWEEQP